MRGISTATKRPAEKLSESSFHIKELFDSTYNVFSISSGRAPLQHLCSSVFHRFPHMCLGLDTDEDGFLTLSDFKTILPDVSLSKMQELVRLLSTDKSGQIS